MQTNELCSTLAAGLASCLILELEDPRKANSNYLSVKGVSIVGRKYQMLRKMRAWG
jgi:hypothetical protein